MDRKSLKYALIARINLLPRQNRSAVDTFISVLSKLIHFMEPDIGFISWVSHATIGKDLHLSKKAVRYYLEAAVLIGALKVKFTNPWLAHKITWSKYGNGYTQYLGGKNFMQLTCPDGSRKRVYFYTINKDWIGWKAGAVLPEWMIEVIRLCARQKQIGLTQARGIAASPERDTTRGHEPAPTRGHEPAPTEEDESAPTRGQPPPTLLEVPVGVEAVRPPTPGQTQEPVTKVVPTPRQQAYLASEAHQRYLRIRAELLGGPNKFGGPSTMA